MKKVTLFTIVFFLFISLGAQEEVHITIKDGIARIPVALPEFHVKNEITPKAAALVKELYTTLWNDLEYSRVFRLVSKDYYKLIKKPDPANINFKDWASIQANILITGEVDVVAEDKLIFAIRVFDIKSGRLIFGNHYSGNSAVVRLIAHRSADQMMKYIGEKPLFDSKLAFVSDRDGDKEIFIMDYDGKRQRQITFNDTIDILPSWSYDNEKLLYTSYRKSRPDLYVFHIYSGKTEIISSKGANFSADWCPDSNKIAYTSTKSGNSEIYVRDMGTGKETRLTFNRIIDVAPSWSPSGQSMAFVSDRSGTAQIYTMGAEGTGVTRLTFEGTRHDSPKWSPDGMRIAYALMLGGSIDIYIYDIKSNEVRKLTERSGRNENPTWSPDGRHIVFASNRTGRYQLYSVDYDGRNIRKLTSKGENFMPFWQKKVN